MSLRGLMGVPGLGCACQDRGLSGFRGLGSFISNEDGTVTDLDTGAIYQAPEGWASKGNYVTPTLGAQVGQLQPTGAGPTITTTSITPAAPNSSGWVADHKASDGTWVNAQGVDYWGNKHDGPSIAQQALSVPGQITGAFGLTPAQAILSGLTYGGVLKRQPTPAPAPAPATGSGLSLGTGLAIGAGLIGGGLLLANLSKKAA